ncbi:CYCL1-1 [Linum perenne]
MGFVCHVEHPHKFISNYLVTLETPPELRQEAWNLANDRYYLLHDSIFFFALLLFWDIFCDHLYSAVSIILDERNRMS